MQRELFTEGKNSYYRNFKGNWYKVYGIGKHTETGEVLVQYCSFYNGCMEFHNRPIEMFLSLTDSVKYPEAEQKFRFMNISELTTQFGTTQAEKYTNKGFYQCFKGFNGFIMGQLGTVFI